jgi:hypothetical protein
MDPFLFGVIVLVGAPAAAAATRWIRGRRQPEAPRPPPKLPANTTTISRDGIRVGDVLTYLGESYWLSGELSLKREGSVVVRLFVAPEKGQDRWLALPRDGQSVWVLEVNKELEAMGFPGVEVPLSGRTLRRTEHGNAAIEPSGEGTLGWEGIGRFALFRAHDRVAVFIEGPDRRRRVALEGREIPRQLIQKMG